MAFVSNEDIGIYLKTSKEFNETNYPTEYLIATNVQKKMENYCGRLFAEDGYQQKKRAINDDDKRVFVLGVPIKKISSVKIDGVETTDYKVTDISVDIPALKQYQQVIVKYTGGFDEIPEELNAVFFEQLMYQINRREKPGAESISQNGGTISYKDIALLTSVKEVLDLYINYGVIS